MREKLVNVSSGDGIRLQGFIEIELVNEKENYKRTYKNTITNAGKQILLARSVGNLLCNTGNLYGDIISVDGLAGDYTYANNSSQLGLVAKYCSNQYQLSNVLLNLGNDLNSLNASTTFLNIKNDDFSVGDKLVGYANSSVTALADGKEGSVEYQKPEYIVDPYTITNRWKYDIGVATGTIDTIAMMPAYSFKNNNIEGFRVMKCIDRVSCQNSNFIAKSTGFCPPGISGLTGSSEILLNFNQDGINRWKYDLGTGEITEVNTADPFIVFTGNVTDVYSEGPYVYALRLSAIATYTNYLYMDVYLKSSGERITSVTVSRGASSVNQESYFVAAKFLIKDSVMYITTMSTTSRGTSTSYGHKVVKMGKGSQEYWSTVVTRYKTFAQSDLGVTVPEAWDESLVCLGNYGDSFVLYTLYEDAKNGYPITAWIVPSLTEIVGTAVTAAYYFLRLNTVLFNTGVYRGAIQIGTYYAGNYTESSAGSTFTPRNQDVKRINNNDGALEIDNRKTGAFISLEDWNSNVMSFVKLQTPIVKQDTDIMYVSYGYKVV